MEGAAQTAAAPAAPPPQAAAAAAPAADRSPKDMMKAFLSAPSDSAPADAGGVPQGHSKAASPADEQASAPTEDSQVPDAADAAEDQGDASDDAVQSDDAQSEERQFSNLTELLEAAGLDSDKGFDLELPVKIDGKEGTAKLRDLIRSYQTDGHINQRLESVNTDRKALQAEVQKFQTERADKLLKLDAGLKTAERVLLGEFAQVDWQKLAAEDPQGYNATYVQFQQRNALLQDSARQLAEETSKHQAEQQERFKAHLAEQQRLVDAKFPEWNDATVRTKDKAEMAAFLEAEGAPKGAFEKITDAWEASVVKKALQWDRLQKAKPATLKKLRDAPRLLKPGSQQSRAAQVAVASRADSERFAQSGRVRDAAPLFKRHLFK